MAEQSLDFETQGKRNNWKVEDMSELRKGPTRTRADCALHQKKHIAPSWDIGFPSFLAWIEAQEIKLRNGTRKFGFWNSGREKRLKRSRCVKTNEGTDRDQASLRHLPEKAHSSLVRYRISEFIGLNQSAREQATQWHKKVWILKLRAREMAKKVKMCQNWGRARPGVGQTAPFTRKST
jgi:hypothetical protein